MNWLECQAAPKQLDEAELRAILATSIAKCCGTTDYNELRQRIEPPLLAAFMSSVLQVRYGPWIDGWNWASSDGGLVDSWCCPTHSVFANEDLSLTATIDRVVASVLEWHGRIKEFAQLFERLLDESIEQEQTLELQAEMAAVAIVNEILAINDGCDAWYHSFNTVFGWYLESIGLEPDAIEDQVGEICDGYFTSWSGPNQEQLTNAAQDLAKLTKTSGELPYREIDTTKSWVAMRDTQWRTNRFLPTIDATSDEHQAFVRRFDFERSEARGEAMLMALDRCREAAAAKIPLDWDLLREWQSLILGQPVDFRSTDAFAKKGRERYPITPGTPKRFKQLLAEVNTADRCPLNAASIVYGDICFFHPFDDGNARLARLALEYVLTRSGLALLLPDPVFKLSRGPHSYQFEQTLRLVVGRKAF